MELLAGRLRGGVPLAHGLRQAPSGLVQVVRRRRFVRPAPGQRDLGILHRSLQRLERGGKGRLECLGELASADRTQVARDETLRRMGSRIPSLRLSVRVPPDFEGALRLVYESLAVGKLLLDGGQPL